MISRQDPISATPFFSIIIASLNNINELRECIDSINKQDFLSYEVLISDGGSSDGTQLILDAHHIRNLSWSKSSPDSGIYYALNAALSEIKGQWILVLGSDDKLNDISALRRACSAMVNMYTGNYLFYTDLLIRDLQKPRLKKYPDFVVFCRRFSGAPFIHHQSAFVARTAILKFGDFDTAYRIHADYDLILRILANGPAVKINDAFVEYNASGYSSRLRNIIRSISEVRHIRRKLGFQGLNFRLCLIYARQLIKSLFNLCSVIK